MSTDALRDAWRCRTGSATRKLVLAALADHGTSCDEGEDWLCWPSIKRQVAFTELADSTVRDTLKGLVADGLILQRRRQNGRGYEYLLLRGPIRAARDPYFGEPPPAGGEKPPVNRREAAPQTAASRRSTSEPLSEPKEKEAPEPARDLTDALARAPQALPEGWVGEVADAARLEQSHVRRAFDRSDRKLAERVVIPANADDATTLRRRLGATLERLGVHLADPR